MERGYVKLWRKALDSGLYSHGFALVGMFSWMLLKANWKTGYWKGQEIEPGTFVTTLSAMAEAGCVSVKVVRNMISKLETLGMITCENRANRGHTITICNWELYQTSHDTEGQTKGKPRANQGQTKGKDQRIKEGKNEKNGNTNTCSEPQGVYELIIPLLKSEEFGITKEQQDEWQESYPAVDVPQALRNIRQWNLSNPSRRKTRRGIVRHITGWLEKIQNGGNGPKLAQAGHQQPFTNRQQTCRLEFQSQQDLPMDEL